MSEAREWQEMEDARVWTMTIAVVGAGALLCLLCGGFLMIGLGARSAGSSSLVLPTSAPMVATVAAPPTTSDAAVILRDAALRPETETSTLPLQTLPAGSVVEVLQRSEQRRVCRDPDCLDLRHQALEFDPEGEGYFWYRLRAANGVEGWVFGRDLAIRADSWSVSGLPDLGWGSRGVLYEDLDHDGTSERVWFAVADAGFEWPTGTLDRTPGGLLVVEDPDTGRAATHAIAGILIGGYGDRVGELAFRDATGDGRTELLLRIDVTVSEVGYGGHEVVILRYRDGALEELFGEHAGVSLIAGVGEARWDRVEVGAGQITLDAVDFEVFSDCRAWTLDEPDTAVDRCLRGEQRIWRWDAAADRFALGTDDDALRVRAAVGHGGLPWRGEPDADAPVEGTFPGDASVLVQQVHDWQTPTVVDGRSTHWVRVEGDDGAGGWVPSRRLLFAPGILQPYMNGEHGAEAQRDPVVW